MSMNVPLEILALPQMQLVWTTSVVLVVNAQIIGPENFAIKVRITESFTLSIMQDKSIIFAHTNVFHPYN